MQWTARTRRHQQAKLVVPFDELKLLLLATRRHPVAHNWFPVYPRKQTFWTRQGNTSS